MSSFSSLLSLSSGKEEEDLLFIDFKGDKYTLLAKYFWKKYIENYDNYSSTIFGEYFSYNYIPLVFFLSEINQIEKIISLIQDNFEELNFKTFQLVVVEKDSYFQLHFPYAIVSISDYEEFSDLVNINVSEVKSLKKDNCYNIFLGEEKEKKEKEKNKVKFYFWNLTEKVLVKTNFREIFSLFRDDIDPEKVNQENAINYFISFSFRPKLSPIKIKRKEEVSLEEKLEFYYPEKEQLFEDLVSLIPNDKFKDFRLWKELGKIYYHTFSYEGLEKWKRYSYNILDEKNPFPNIEKDLSSLIRELWNDYSIEQSLSIKTLAWYARMYNYNKYKFWEAKWIGTGLEKALSLTDSDIGEFIYRYCWLELVYYAEGNNSVWYSFYNGRWRKEGIELFMNNIISSKIISYIEDKINILRKLLSLDKVEVKNEELSDKEEVLIKLIKKLKTVSAKRNIFYELRSKFFERDFMKNLNNNPNILGMENGILEIIDGKVFLREAKPEDYISLSTGINYEELSFDDEKVKFCLNWIKKIFIDEELIDYFLRFSASILKAGNNDKKLFIFIGSGDNSKSAIVKLFEFTFGKDYSSKVPVNFYSEKSSSNASPHLARTEYKRIVFSDEADDDIALAKGPIKRFTGGDTFFARFLYENGRELTPSFKAVLSCNIMPFIRNADKATKNRIVFLPFDSIWTENAPVSEEEQMKKRRFPIDFNFSDKIRFLAPAFLWILVQYWPKYKEKGIKKMPEIVEQATERYWLENDIYKYFISDKIEYDENSNLNLEEAYRCFKEWYKQNFGNTKIPDKITFRKEMETDFRLYKLSSSKSWNGIKLKKEEDDEII